jgi:serine/threonine protein kinase
MSEKSGSTGQSPYRIVRVVGSGGMGVVHEAWDTRLDRRVALKIMHPHLLSNPSLSTRFQKEARRAARIEHPNVVRVYRVDEWEGQVAIEMQFVEGRPLSSVLQAGPLSPFEAADVLRQVLEALQACHEHGVIHCDLKPGNLILADNGLVMLTDFGIARAFYEGVDASGTETMSAPLWGTPQYTAPETWEEGAVSPQCDLYAAGTLIYEAIAGKLPYPGNTPIAVIKSVLTTSPLPIKTLAPDISDAFAGLVEDLIARTPALRPATARIALEMLRKTPEFDVQVAQTAPIFRHVGVHPVRRTRLWGAIGAFVLIALHRWRYFQRRFF